MSNSIYHAIWKGKLVEASDEGVISGKKNGFVCVYCEKPLILKKMPCSCILYMLQKVFVIQNRAFIKQLNCGSKEHYRPIYFHYRPIQY